MSVPSVTYDRRVLFGTESFEIVSCEWNVSSVSPLHAHGWSQCLVLIEEGQFENRVDFGHSHKTKVYSKGQVISTPVGALHEIRCLTAVGKTLHVYVPKITTEPQLRFDPAAFSELRSLPEFQLGEAGLPFSEVQRALNRLRGESISTASPYFMNQLFSGVFAETLVAREVQDQLRTTLATFESGPGVTAIELVLVERLGASIGWVESAREGVSVPGGSSANFMAVHCARIQKDPEAKIRGNGLHRYQVFASKASHYSLKKACVALGLGTSALVLVDCDENDQIKIPALERALHASVVEGYSPLMVTATAGTTVMGAFDPIGEMATLCRRHDMWLHVDAAWGGPALFSCDRDSFVGGIEQADSVTFDAHKLFGSALTASFFLTRHKQILLEANDVSGGDYIFHSQDVIQDRGRLSWQCGRGADFLSFWTLWKHLGAKGLGGFVDRLLGLQRQVVEWVLTQPRLELVGDPRYLNVCVRVLPPQGQDRAWSLHVREALKKSNRTLVNFSANDDGPFLRLVLAHPRITFEDVRNILSWALEVE